MAMHPSMDRIRATLTSATKGMTDREWSQHPEGKWCAAEVVEHLSLTYSGTAEALRRVLVADKPAATSLRLKQRVGIFYVITLGRFPEGRKAPKQVVPTGSQDGANILAQAVDHLAKMDAALTACENRFGSETRISNHPVLGALTASQWRKFHAIHASHHVPQIERLRKTG